jgi:hypothetical protein
MVNLVDSYHGSSAFTTAVFFKLGEQADRSGISIAKITAIAIGLMLFIWILLPIAL